MQSQLEEYAESLKMGRNVVIKEDDQLARSKIEMIKQEFNLEMEINKEKIIDLTKELETVNKNYEKECLKVKALKQELNEKGIEHEESNVKIEIEVKKL